MGRIVLLEIDMNVESISSRVSRAREKMHKLAGLLAGTSAAVYCAKAARDRQEQMEAMSHIESMVNEAMTELTELREIVKSLDNKGA